MEDLDAPFFDQDPLGEYLLYLRQFKQQGGRNDQTIDVSEIGSGGSAGSSSELGADAAEVCSTVSLFVEAKRNFHFLMLYQHQWFLMNLEEWMNDLSAAYSRCWVDHSLPYLSELERERNSLEQETTTMVQQSLEALREKDQVIKELKEKNASVEKRLLMEKEKVRLLQQDLNQCRERELGLRDCVLKAESLLQTEKTNSVQLREQNEAEVHSLREEIRNLSFEVYQLKELHSSYLHKSLKCETENELFMKENLKLKRLLLQLYAKYFTEVKNREKVEAKLERLEKQRGASSYRVGEASREDSGGSLLKQHPAPLYVTRRGDPIPRGGTAKEEASSATWEELCDFLQKNGGDTGELKDGMTGVVKWLEKEHYYYISEVEYTLHKKVSLLDQNVSLTQQLQRSDISKKMGTVARQIYEKGVELNEKNELLMKNFTSLNRKSTSGGGSGSVETYTIVLLEQYRKNIQQFLHWMKTFLQETVALSSEALQTYEKEGEQGGVNTGSASGDPTASSSPSPSGAKPKDVKEVLLREIKGKKSQQHIDYWKKI